MRSRRFCGSVVLLIALSFAPLANAGIVFGPNGSGGYNAYDTIAGSFTWDEARVNAMAISFPGYGAIPANAGLFGHLVTVASLAENNAAAGSGGGDRWIGLTDATAVSSLDGFDPVVSLGTAEFGNTSGLAYPPAGQTPGATPGTQRGEGWAWITGEPLIYQNWGGGEPNDWQHTAAGEDAAHLTGGTTWNDDRAGPTIGNAAGRTMSYIIEWDLNLASMPDTPFLNVGPAGAWDLFGIREVTNNGVISSVTAAQNSLLSGLGTIYDGTGPVVNHNDPNNPGGGGYFGNAGKLPFLSDQPGVDDNDISFLANGTILIDTPGYYTFGFRGDDGSQLKIDGAVFEHRWGGATAYGNIFTFEGPTGDSNSGAATYLGSGTHRLEFTFFERDGGAYVELWAAQGDFSGFNGTDFHLIGDTGSGGLQLVNLPEPTTLCLLGLGLVAARRRRKK